MFDVVLADVSSEAPATNAETLAKYFFSLFFVVCSVCHPNLSCGFSGQRICDHESGCSELTLQYKYKGSLRPANKCRKHRNARRNKQNAEKREREKSSMQRILQETGVVASVAAERGQGQRRRGPGRREKRDVMPKEPLPLETVRQETGVVASKAAGGGQGRRRRGPGRGQKRDVMPEDPLPFETSESIGVGESSPVSAPRHLLLLPAPNSSHIFSQLSSVDDPLHAGTSFSITNPSTQRDTLNVDHGIQAMALFTFTAMDISNSAEAKDIPFADMVSPFTACCVLGSSALHSCLDIAALSATVWASLFCRK